MTDAELLLATEALSGVGGWRLDANTGQLCWTPQTFRLHGLPPEAPQPTPEQALALLVPDDRQRLQEVLNRLPTTGGRAELRVCLQQPPSGVRPQLHLVATCAAPGASVQGTAQAVAMLPPEAGDFAAAATGVGVFETRFDTGEAWWSDATLQLHGLPPGSVAPTREEWRERFLHPDDLVRADTRAAEFVAGRPYELDYRIRRADTGELRWLHTRAAWTDESHHRVLGLALDVTERKRAEERALGALHALELSATEVGFGFGFRDLQGDEGEWSPQLKRMFGMAPDAPTPTRAELLERIDAADRPRMVIELAARPAVGELRDIEYTVPLPDGQRRVLMTRAVVRADTEGRPWRYDFVVFDLTAARARDRQVAELLERLRLATEASGIGTWERDPLDQHARWDDTMFALFGLAPGRPVPSTREYLQIVHPDDRDRVAAFRRETEKTLGDIFEIPFRVVWPSGQLHWLLLRGRTHHDETGHVIKRSGICFDITERHQAEAALRAKELAERANAAKTEFLSRMSHELRTPLNAVLGFAQLLALDATQPLSEAQRARVTHIQTAGWHLLALINDVLDLSRIESRQIELHPELVPLPDVVGACLSMHAADAATRGIRLDALHEAEPALTAWADRTRLKQVLLNLLSNAIKYNRDGGWVQVATRREASGDVSLRVRDGGFGLSAEQQAQLFEPFNRLGREQGAAEGTGIGLTLSKLIAEQMGGQLSVSSTPGQGSEFCLTLPASR